MKRVVLNLVILMMSIGFLSAQRPAPDRIETSKGPLMIQPINHACLAFQWDNKTIYVDPYGGAPGFAGLPAPNLILITDIHGDHLAPSTLDALETSKTTFVVPPAVAEQLSAAYKAKAVVIANNESKDIEGIKIEALPMYNLPESPDARHTKGRGNGYVLTFGNVRVYLSGDTDDIPEMRALKNIDVAFVCMNPPYTMDINKAADAILAFKPKVIYPYHYRGSDVEAFKKLVNAKNSAIDVRLRNWYP